MQEHGFNAEKVHAVYRKKQRTRERNAGYVFLDATRGSGPLSFYQISGAVLAFITAMRNDPKAFVVTNFWAFGWYCRFSWCTSALRWGQDQAILHSSGFFYINKPSAYRSLFTYHFCSHRKSKLRSDVPTAMLPLLLLAVPALVTYGSGGR